MLNKIEIFTDMQGKPLLEEAIKKLKGKDILIYGAGSFGKEMLTYFNENGISISAFLDKNADNIRQINRVPTFTLESYPHKRGEQIVIFAIVCDKIVRKSIIENIKRSGFENVIEAQSLRCLDVHFSDGYNVEKQIMTERIYKALALMSDDKSRNIFLNNIYAHFSGDYSKCEEYEDPMLEQYFPKDIENADAYSVFVDCGGFTGDTVEAVIKKYDCKKVISFEPFPKNYIKLTETCEKLSANTEFILYNSAVCDKISQVFFKSGTGSGTFSPNGDILVNTVSIDKAFMGIAPTFIKMDIEGEEINALNGARKTIEKYSPDMAVCVYHNIDHIWEIPLLIDSINNSYDFYLRSYNACTMETVLYAIKKER